MAVNREERFAIAVREAGDRIADAYRDKAKAEAVLARTIAAAMLESGEKSVAAQTRYADDHDMVFTARLDLGVAEGELGAARAELKACEIDFEHWRTRMATQRIERRGYGDR